MSSEGAAAASAAAKRRGDASRKAKRQARAPEEDIPRRPRAMDNQKRTPRNYGRKLRGVRFCSTRSASFSASSSD